MKDLTDRQREVLQFITSYIDIHTYSPSIREIGTNFSISVKGAHDHVTALKRKGFVRADSRPRTMELVRQGGDRKNEIVKIPILGSVAAGTPILAEENWEGVLPVSRSFLKDGPAYFVLRVRGDSMEGAGILEGDFAVIEQRDIVENGEIIVALLEEAMTLKRFFREKNRIRLQPENDRYEPIYTRDLRVLGRLSHIIRSY